MKSSFDVLWASVAESDLRGIVEYVAQDSPPRALSVLRRLGTATARLSRSPARGRIVPELKRQGVVRYRELVVTPWRMIYRIEDRSVYVLAVVDSRRNVEDVLLERLVT